MFTVLRSKGMVKTTITTKFLENVLSKTSIVKAKRRRRGKEGKRKSLKTLSYSLRHIASNEGGKTQ